jgi:glycine betaine/choline ABC-type transport system substrate-binding protein
MAVGYGLEFKRVVDMEFGLMYIAVAAGEIDVIAAYSTGGRNVALNLAWIWTNRPDRNSPVL